MSSQDRASGEGRADHRSSSLAALGVTIFAVGAYSTGAALVKVSATVYLSILIPLTVLTVLMSLFAARATGASSAGIKRAGLVFGGYGFLAAVEWAGAVSRPEPAAGSDTAAL